MVCGFIRYLTAANGFFSEWIWYSQDIYWLLQGEGAYVLAFFVCNSTGWSDIAICKCWDESGLDFVSCVSCFSTAHRRLSVYFIMVRDYTCSFLWGGGFPGPHLLHGSLGSLNPCPKQQFDWFVSSRAAHDCVQTHILHAICVATGHIFALHACDAA